MKHALTMLAAIALLTAQARAAEPRFDQIVIGTSAEASQSQSSFRPDTPQIVIQAQLPEVLPGTKVAAIWIAEKTAAAPPNYRIDAAEFAMDGSLRVAVFSLSRPTAGWPLGAYRVELLVNGKPATQVRFTVE